MERKQRLIDANDAEKFAREHILDAKERFLILDFLRECSTVDAVEVVRCKDCSNCTQSMWCNLLMMDVKGDDFCSHGERKKTDGE